MRPVALTMVITAAGLLAVACTNTQPGQAVPPTGQPAATSGSNGLIGLNACTLLTDAEARQVLPTVKSHVDSGAMGGPGTSVCQWTAPATNETGSLGFGIGVRPAQAISDVTKNPEYPDATLSTGKTTGGRNVVIAKNNRGKGSCQISIAVESGRIDIDGETFRGTTDDSCSVVSKVSDFVEPRLPAS